MGTTNSLSKSDFQSMSSIKTPFKGPYIIKENETLILRELIFFNEASFLKAKALFDHIIKDKNNYILPIKEYSIETKEIYCANAFYLSLFLENYKRDLESEIGIRKTAQHYFTREEICGLAYSVLRGLQYLRLNEKEYIHGGISLKNIIMTKAGQVQIIEGNIAMSASVSEGDDEINKGKDFFDLVKVLIKMIRLQKELCDIDFENFDDPFYNFFFGELKKGDKPIKYFLNYLRLMKNNQFDKEAGKNKENYMSFGDKNSIQLQKPLEEISQNPKNVIKETYEDGSFYEGEMKEDTRHGKGTFKFSKGGTYKGDWVLGKMHGYGILFYPSGKIAYEGEWKNDVFEGKGRMINENFSELSQENAIDYNDFDCEKNFNLWKEYCGEFKNDKKEGIGTLLFSNGEKFVGIFKDNKAEGSGAFQTKSGERINGKWADNKLKEKI